jgi:hypothetical protein
MKKPIVRWTIGDAVKTNSLRCLRYSIKSFFDIYKDRFDYYLMFNSKNPPPLCFSFINMLDQRAYRDSLPRRPHGFAWKLYPPRLDIEVPEIFIDNDLIIYKEIDEIEALITHNTPFITRDAFRVYGSYDKMIDKDTQINSGFFGLPRNFDLKRVLLDNFINEEWDGWDEQGLVAKIMLAINSTIIPLEKISVLTPTEEGEFGTHGTHFVVLNRQKEHINWIRFYEKIEKIEQMNEIKQNKVKLI